MTDSFFKSRRLGPRPSPLPGHALGQDAAAHHHRLRPGHVQVERLRREWAAQPPLRPQDGYELARPQPAPGPLLQACSQGEDIKRMVVGEMGVLGRRVGCAMQACSARHVRFTHAVKAANSLILSHVMRLTKDLGACRPIKYNANCFVSVKIRSRYTAIKHEFSSFRFSSLIIIVRIISPISFQPFSGSSQRIRQMSITSLISLRYVSHGLHSNRKCVTVFGPLAQLQSS